MRLELANVEIAELVASAWPAASSPVLPTKIRFVTVSRFDFRIMKLLRSLEMRWHPTSIAGFVETTPNNYGLINQKTSASIRNQSNCMEAIIRHRSCALEASMMMLLLMLMMTVTPAIGH